MTVNGGRTSSWTVSGSFGSISAISSNADRSAIIPEDDLKKSDTEDCRGKDLFFSFRISSWQASVVIIPYLVVAARCLLEALPWPLCQLQWVQAPSVNFLTFTVRSLVPGSAFWTSSSALCFPFQQDSLRSDRDCGSSAAGRRLQRRRYEFAP